MKHEQKVQIEMSEYICLVKRIDGVVAQKELRSELIRCGECKHRPIGGEAYNHTLIFPDEFCPCNCVDDNWYSWMPDDDWFCGNGERKEE